MDPLAKLKSLPLPFAALMGIEFVEASAERVVGEMTVREDLCTRPAVLHGGAVVNLPEGAWTTTLESKTNFIAGAPMGARVRGEATPIHRGRRTQVWQTRVMTADGKLVAVVTQTQLVLPAGG